MPKILKFWHQWSWAISVIAYVFMFGAMVATRENAIAENTKHIATIEDDRYKENMPVRMATQEESTKNIKETLGRMEMVQGKIFERINQIADRGGR